MAEDLLQNRETILEDSQHVINSLPGAPPPVRSLLTILTRRKWLLAQVAGAVLLLALVVALLMPHSYNASVLMVLTGSGAGSSSGSNSTATTPGDAWALLQSDLSMQIRLIRRPEIAASVIKQLRLNDQPELVLKKLTVARAAGMSTNLLNISYRGETPAQAQKIANAWAKAAVSDSLTKGDKSTVAAIQFVQQQIATIENELQQTSLANARVEQKQISAGLGPEGGEAADKLQGLIASRNGLLAQEIAVRAQVEESRRQVAVEPAMLKSLAEMPTQATKAAQAELLQLHTQLDQLRTDYYEDSPEVKAVKEQIAPLEKYLAQQSGLTQIVSTAQDSPNLQRLVAGHGSLLTQLRGLETQRKELDRQVEVQEKVALGVPGITVDYNALNRKITALAAVYGSLLSRLYSLQLEKVIAVPAIDIAQLADLPKSPVEPPKRVIVALGLLLGLLLAVVAAVIVDQLDDTFANLAEIDDSVPQRRIGALPQHLSRWTAGLILLEDPRGPFANAVRRLASAVRMEMGRSNLHSLAVTSAGPSEGKSLTSANLAASLAKSGMNVLLVDADLHKPVLHKPFGLPNQLGLSNVLVGSSSVAEVQQVTQVENLLFIASGPQPPSPVDLFTSEAGEQVLREINKLADIVIWDTPPAGILADATVVGALADRTLFVIGQKAKRGLVQETLRNLHEAGIKVIGVAANQVRRAGGAQYAYCYHDPDAQNGKKASE